MDNYPKVQRDRREMMTCPVCGRETYVMYVDLDAGTRWCGKCEDIERGKNMSEFKIVYGEEGDWEGLYKDGKLVTEGHEISRYELFKHLGIECPELRCKEDWLENRGNFPKLLSDVELEVQ